MGVTQSKKGDPIGVKQLSEETGFELKALRHLFIRFEDLDRTDKGYLTRADFLNIKGLTINPIGDRIVHAFFKESQTERVDFQDFVRVLARFRPLDSKVQRLNSKEDKLRFLFGIFDLNGDNVINTEELLEILMSMTGDTLPEQELQGIVQRSMYEADVGEDNHIELKQFFKLMEEEPVAEKMSLHFWC